MLKVSRFTLASTLIALSILPAAAQTLEERLATLESSNSVEDSLMDPSFFEDAYSDAEAGRTFSYAGQWGTGKAYDGTDTSHLFRQPFQRMQESDVAQQTSAPQRVSQRQVPSQPLITREAPRSTAAQRYQRQSPAVVNTIRTVASPQNPDTGVQTGRAQPMAKAAARTGSPMAKLPPAKVGECYARMRVPAQYDLVEKPFKISEPYKRARIHQAEFASDLERVVMKDAHTTYVITKPRFETRREKLTVRPAHERLEVIPARFDYSPETVSVSEPRLVWKKGAGLSGISRTDPMTGDTWCLVEEPGETLTLRQRVVTKPEQIRRVSVPEQVITVPRQVLVEPARVKEVKVPAQTRDFTVQRLVAPARADAYEVPAEMKPVTTKVLKQEERFEWVQVLCDSNAGPGTIKRLQSALRQRGLYTGAIDGVFGPQSRQALIAFQRSAGLVHLGYLTTQTMVALGLR